MRLQLCRRQQPEGEDKHCFECQKNVGREVGRKPPAAEVATGDAARPCAGRWTGSESWLAAPADELAAALVAAVAAVAAADADPRSIG